MGLLVEKDVSKSRPNQSDRSMLKDKDYLLTISEKKSLTFDDGILDQQKRKRRTTERMENP